MQNLKTPLSNCISLTRWGIKVTPTFPRATKRYLVMVVQDCICTSVYDCMYSNFPAKNTLYTVYTYVCDYELWSTLKCSVRKTQHSTFFLNRQNSDETLASSPTNRKGYMSSGLTNSLLFTAFEISCVARMEANSLCVSKCKREINCNQL